MLLVARSIVNSRATTSASQMGKPGAVKGHGASEHPGAARRRAGSVIPPLPAAAAAPRCSMCLCAQALPLAVPIPKQPVHGRPS